MTRIISQKTKWRVLLTQLCLFISLCLNAQEFNFKATPIKEILSSVTQSTGYSFIYSNLLKDLDKKVDFNYTAKNNTIEPLLAQLFENTDILYSVKDKQVVLQNKELKSSNVDKGKTHLISGVITDDSGTSVPGASVFNKTRNKYTATGLEGDYSIDANVGDILIFSSIGMKECSYTVSEKSNQYNLQMFTDVIALDDIIVTGYQTLSKERATGSFTKVTSQELEKFNSTSIGSKLQTLMNGVYVDRSGNIEIRGLSTLNTSGGKSDPLIVVDGFPIEGGLSSVNPNDIETITILKDAAAASIYGIKSANGVIVITRKSAANENFIINANVNYSLSKLPDLTYFDKMNAKDAVDYQWEALEKGYYKSILSNNLTGTTELAKAYTMAQNGDIQGAEAIKQKLSSFGDLAAQQYRDELFRRSTQGQYEVSISGGGKNADYYVSGRVEDNNAYTRGSRNTKLFLDTRLNLKLNNHISFQISTTNNYTNSDANSPISAYNYSRAVCPFEPLIIDGQLNPIGDKSISFKARDLAKSLGLLPAAIEYNPINELNARNNTTTSSYNRYQVGANYKFDMGLKIDVKYQYETGASNNTNIASPEVYSQAKLVNDLVEGKTTETLKYNLARDKMGLQKSLSDWNSHIIRGVLNYEKSFKEQHYVSALAGIEFQMTETKDVSEKYSQYDPITGALIPEMINTKQKLTNWSGNSKNIAISDHFAFNNKTYNQRYFSTFFNLGYSLKSKYNLTGSFRIDQSNIFGTETKNRYKPMWSVGASWNMKKEAFLKDISTINNLTFRVTYGLTGMIDKSTSPYIIIQKNKNNYVGEFATFPNAPNKNLRWEQTRNFNIGIDYSLLNNRLSGYIEYYNKYTTDVIAPTESDPTNGFASIVTNMAEISNKGLDVNINSLNINKEFKWSTSFNFNMNFNKIERLYANEGLSAQYYVAGTDLRQLYIGEYPIGQLNSYNWGGLDKNGYAQVYDKNGVLKNAKDNPTLYGGDLIYQGTTQPPYFGNFTNTFSWNNLSLAISITYKMGHKTRAEKIDSNGYDEYYTSASSRRWRESGDELSTNIPGLADMKNINSYTYYTYGSYNTVNASHIRLSFINLSYTLPSNLCNKIKLKGLKFTFQAENLGIIWRANNLGIDPDAHTTDGLRSFLPALPTYTFGINIKL